HGFGRAATDGDLAFWVDLGPLPAHEAVCNRPAKVTRSPGDRVLVDICGDGLLRGALDLFRRGEIGEALREVDRAELDSMPRHLADYGLSELLDLPADSHRFR